MPRGHSNGYMVFPWGLNITIISVVSLKHTWSNKAIANTISAYVRGSTFSPHPPPYPVATLNWYQAWGVSGKGVLVFSLGAVFHGAYIELLPQRSIPCNS